MAKRHLVTNETKALVAQWTADGGTHEQIAARLSISVDTLTRHYRDVLDSALAVAVMRLGRTIYERGMAGDNTAAIFWLKCRGGWREADRREVAASNANARVGVSCGVMIVPAPMSEEEWERTVSERQARLLARS